MNRAVPVLSDGWSDTLGPYTWHSRDRCESPCIRLFAVALHMNQQTSAVVLKLS